MRDNVGVDQMMLKERLISIKILSQDKTKVLTSWILLKALSGSAAIQVKIEQQSTRLVHREKRNKAQRQTLYLISLSIKPS